MTNLNYDVPSPVQTTGMNTAGNDLSAEMKTYYCKVLLQDAELNLVHDQFGTREPIPAGGGKIIEFNKFDALPKNLTPLTEGVTPQDKRAYSTITAPTSQYGDYLTVFSQLELMALDPTISQATREIAAQAGKTLDTITREKLAAGTNILYAFRDVGGVETTTYVRADLDNTAVLSSEMVRYAASKLARQNAPKISGDYACICHPDITYDLKKDTEWLDAHKYTTPENIYNNEVGKLHGVRFVETTEAKIIAPNDIFEGVPRLTLKTELDSTGSTTITVNEAISAAQVTELTAAVAAGTVKIYVGGKEATLASTPATAGVAGAASLTVTAAVKSVASGAVICGQGAAKNGNAVYTALFIGQGAYGVTEITGGGLEYIFKPKGSGGTADPLNQRATIGWRANKTVEILNQQYMVRVECCSKRYSASAVAN